MEFFNWNNIHLSIGIVLSVVNAVLMCFAGYKFLQIIQLSGYKISGFRAWLKDTKVKYVGRLAILSFLSLACVLVTNALFDGFGEFYSYVGLIFYFYFTIVFIINMYRTPQKTPLKQTKRMNRLTAVTFLLMAGITFGLIVVCSEYVNPIRFGIVAITPIFLPFVVPLAHLIMVPVEELIRLIYVNKAKKKLKKYPYLTKIGITGSFGKTTTKNILNAILSKKYRVCTSPHSFNTPMGITKVVLSYLKPEHEILIVEMGARQLGDISYLCRIVEPKHAIITSVGNQHIATFGTAENVAKEKNELAKSINKGFVAFNCQNPGAKKLFDACEKEKFSSGIDGDYFANITNINLSAEGSSFDLTIDGKTISCKTKLLGLPNLEDIAVSAALAYKLDVKMSDIKSAISSLKPIPHRMELIEENGLSIIDNSFNSSVESAKSAIETLALFNGKKIVVTPGLVELGAEEFSANQTLGEQIAAVADKVIIVNKLNSEALTRGLIAKGYDEANMLYAETLDDAKKLLKENAEKGDVILFQNDFPDNYT